MKQRLLVEGPAQLGDDELLTILLGPSRAAAVQVALRDIGGLSGLARIGPAAARRSLAAQESAAPLSALAELARRLDCSCRRLAQPLRDPEAVHRLLRARLRYLRQEVFIVVGLDARQCPVLIEQVAQGSATSVAVHPREVYGPLVRASAVFGILAHNHPSGDAEPSAEDYALTKRLRDVGQLLGIPVVDHLVIGDDDYVSMADRGML